MEAYNSTATTSNIGPEAAQSVISLEATIGLTAKTRNTGETKINVQGPREP